MNVSGFMRFAVIARSFASIFFGRHDLLADHVATAFGRHLVFDEHRLHAHALVGSVQQRCTAFFHVAVAIVRIDEDRQIARADHVAECRGEFAKLAQADVGQPVARARGLEPADEKSLEARLLDQERGQRVVRAGQHQRFFGAGELAYRW